MKKIILILFFFTTITTAQDYVDILKVSYGNSFNHSFEGFTDEMNIKSLDADFTYPIVIDENNAIITGFLHSNNNLQLFPDSFLTQNPLAPQSLSKRINLYSTVLKIGLATNFNEKWSGTFVVLPNLSSDYKDISSDDLYLGGVAVIKYQKNEHLKYRLGIYAMDQAYGIFTTPILGFYYLSPNERLEVDASLPISADVNYRFENWAVGVDYFGIGRSFDIHQENTPDYYVDYGSLDFSIYAQYAMLEKSILLRGKLGYSDIDAEAYEDGDNIDLRISAFDFGSERTQLNPINSGGIFAKVEVLYRFNLSKVDK
ncbi:hypothetical protein ULMS_02500 [Patiriisocius marinistellae]|uniref:DUF6268 domain-containing protein n=1 Tax=Patiriisocius marinistellae TaxID=2494560 RepID=A0A5J4FUQ4_9FLAO|nr:DUF6268 family outer membrane beta-barrel protein [Patiriisocius marinistellae]GEQ84742.1 hypothetical protein ULMS_02500 [Patiriisocius marinistellae]